LLFDITLEEDPNAFKPNFGPYFERELEYVYLDLNSDSIFEITFPQIVIFIDGNPHPDEDMTV
jgi:hypothetical protein